MADFNTFNPLEMFRAVANSALKNQIRNPNDYINEDGLLCCGKCKEPKQEYFPFEEKIDGKSRVTPVKVTRICLCDREREKEAVRTKEMQRISNLKTASLMDAKFANVSFDSLQVTEYNSRNIKLCKRYAYHFDEMLKKSQGLMFWGGVGTGKSCAAAAIANHLLSEGTPVVMTSFVKIVEEIQAKRLTDAILLNSLNNADLVIFDDLGAERKTDFALEIVYNAIDDRCRKNLPMIVTTNRTLDEMKNESDIRYIRIYDRLFEACYPMHFTGPSWRKKMAFQKYGEMEGLLDLSDENHK